MYVSLSFSGVDWFGIFVLKFICKFRQKERRSLMIRIFFGIVLGVLIYCGFFKL